MDRRWGTILNERRSGTSRYDYHAHPCEPSTHNRALHRAAAAVNCAYLLTISFNHRVSPVALLKIKCPECGAGLKSPTGFTVGQTVCCPKCETYFPVEEPEEEAEEAPKKSAPAGGKPAPAKKPVKAAADEDEDEEEDEEEAPKKKKKKKRRDDDDEDGGRSYKNSPLRFIILGILIIIMLVLGYMLYEKKKKEKEDNAAAGGAPPALAVFDPSASRSDRV